MPYAVSKQSFVAQQSYDEMGLYSALLAESARLADVSDKAPGTQEFEREDWMSFWLETTGVELIRDGQLVMDRETVRQAGGAVKVVFKRIGSA